MPRDGWAPYPPISQATQGLHSRRESGRCPPRPHPAKPNRSTTPYPAQSLDHTLPSPITRPHPTQPNRSTTSYPAQLLDHTLPSSITRPHPTQPIAQDPECEVLAVAPAFVEERHADGESALDVPTQPGDNTQLAQ